MFSTYSQEMPTLLVQAPRREPLHAFPHRLVSYLIFLLEPVALASLHLGDVLQQVSHPDGGLELVPRIAHLHGVAGPVGVRLDREGGLGQLSTAAICFKEKEAEQTITDESFVR